MADAHITRAQARDDYVAKAYDRATVGTLADVMAQIWDDGYGHGRDDEAAGEPTMVPSDEDLIRDAMVEAAASRRTPFTCTRHGVTDCPCLTETATMASAIRPPGGYPAGTVSR